MPWPRSGIHKMTPRGKKVFLSKRAWFRHIQVDHPELANQLDEVLKTIEEPEGIYLDRAAYVSFRFSEKMGINIMIVYRLAGDTGTVKTAYTTFNPYIEVKPLIRVWPI